MREYNAMNYSNSSSALRSATEKASLDFYNELADKTLLIINKLEGYQNNPDTPVTVERVKKELGINYKVLNKVLSDLSNEGALEFYVSSEKRTNYSTSDMQIEVTGLGQVMTRRALESLQRKASIL